MSLNSGMNAILRIGLALLLVAPGAAAAWPHAPAARPAPAVAPAVAPAPARRAPARAVGLGDLRAELDRLIRTPTWRSDQWSVLVVSLDQRDTLFSHEPDLPLAPASNMKLFTSAAALYYLGADFRYSTYLLADGPVQDGVLRGDLVVYGTGDPTLSDRFYGSKTTVWEEFADTLASLGIRQVAGAVVGDASYFGGARVGSGWQERYISATYAAPASALAFNDNIVTLRITPGPRAGAPPAVLLLPGGKGMSIINEARTVSRGRTTIDVSRNGYDGPIVLRGQIGRRAGAVWRAVPVPDPALYSATVLSEVLERRGIAVGGGVRSVARPEESPVTGRSVFAPAFDSRPALQVLAVHRSPTLREVLDVVNKQSHNFYAEQVLRTVGRVAIDDGTVRGGARAVHHLLLRETAADSQSLHMDDGSGLSLLNRATARSFIHLLDYMARSPMWNAFRETLPEAGQQGLRRMYRTPAERNLRAKTGTINNVSALSGYVRAANGERLAFSIISNGVPSTWRAKRVEDAIGIRLAAFDRSTPDRSDPEAAAAAAEPPRPERTSSARAGRSHVVKPGETLSHIAVRYGTTVKALQRANPRVSPKRIRPGQRLRIP